MKKKNLRRTGDANRFGARFIAVQMEVDYVFVARHGRAENVGGLSQSTIAHVCATITANGMTAPPHTLLHLASDTVDNSKQTADDAAHTIGEEV